MVVMVVVAWHARGALWCTAQRRVPRSWQWLYRERRVARLMVVVTTRAGRMGAGCLECGGLLWWGCRGVQLQETGVRPRSRVTCVREL